MYTSQLQNDIKVRVNNECEIKRDRLITPRNTLRFFGRRLQKTISQSFLMTFAFFFRPTFSFCDWCRTVSSFGSV